MKILRTLWRIHINKVWLRSEHYLLKDNGEAVDIPFLSSVDRSSRHTQQFRCGPQLITIISELAHLRQAKEFNCMKCLFGYQCKNTKICVYIKLIVKQDFNEIYRYVACYAMN